jgi:hypothetical protein
MARNHIYVNFSSIRFTGNTPENTAGDTAFQINSIAGIPVPLKFHAPVLTIYGRGTEALQLGNERRFHATGAGSKKMMKRHRMTECRRVTISEKSDLRIYSQKWFYLAAHEP